MFETNFTRTDIMTHKHFLQIEFLQKCIFIESHYTRNTITIEHLTTY